MISSWPAQACQSLRALSRWPRPATHDAASREAGWFVTASHGRRTGSWLADVVVHDGPRMLSGDVTAPAPRLRAGSPGSRGSGSRGVRLGRFWGGGPGSGEQYDAWQR